MFMSRIENILKKCFWDYDFTEDDIIKIVNEEGKTKMKKFLFEKILINSDDVINDLKIFKKEDLVYYLKNFKVPKFNHEFINTRYLILKNYFLNEKVNIPILEWRT